MTRTNVTSGLFPTCTTLFATNTVSIPSRCEARRMISFTAPGRASASTQILIARPCSHRPSRPGPLSRAGRFLQADATDRPGAELVDQDLCGLLHVDRAAALQLAALARDL